MVEETIRTLKKFCLNKIVEAAFIEYMPLYCDIPIENQMFNLILKIDSLFVKIDAEDNEYTIRAKNININLEEYYLLSSLNERINYYKSKQEDDFFKELEYLKIENSFIKIENEKINKISIFSISNNFNPYGIKIEFGNKEILYAFSSSNGCTVKFGNFNLDLDPANVNSFLGESRLIEIL